MSPSDEHLGTSARAQVGGRKSGRGNRRGAIGGREWVAANRWARDSVGSVLGDRPVEPGQDGVDAGRGLGLVVRAGRAAALHRDPTRPGGGGRGGPRPPPATGRGRWWRDWAKYGAPESYRQALVVG